MAWIAGSEGIFRLDESDEHCGSMILLQDACVTLGVEADAMASLPQKHIAGAICINELDIHRAWSRGAIPGSPANRTRGATRFNRWLFGCPNSFARVKLPKTSYSHEQPENAFIESFKGRLRDECLNVHQFTSIEDAKTTLEAWRIDYKQRPGRTARSVT